MTTLGEDLPKEIERVKELIALYESVEYGFIAAGLMKETIRLAEHAMIQGDLVGMIQYYKELKGYE